MSSELSFEEIFPSEQGEGEKISGAAKPNYWLLQGLGWLFYYLVMAVDNIIFYGEYNVLGLKILYVTLPIALVGFLVTLPMRHLFRRCWGLPTLSLGLVILFTSLIASFLWAIPKNIILSYQFEDEFQRLLNGDLDPLTLFMNFSFSFFILMVWSSLYFGINYHFRLIEAQALRYRAAKLSHVAQIRMLRYQINPHFLFNTLNAVSTLVMRGDKQRCNRMLSQLATFLRFSLDSDPEKKIPLLDEIQALMLYLDIEKTRFGERLHVELHVAPQTEQCRVPSLLIQPLVENCIKHAIAKMATGGKIVIRTWLEHNLLHLQVADNGPLTDLNLINNNGVGLQNIIQRLEVLYGANQRFVVEQVRPQGLSVTIVIPNEGE
ncbi:histidine kinase [Aliiglaciecola sp. CAU 1673]|uniref:sensor histidine kinase n=1 Tax=Aliiglaciecola sp. CAU 1673 TaxID=3032595 RepID=UPI0023DC0FBD|nr:histidine kinase [Aliiglaciecola sp. CAU 1673]MDF2176692.1 histidine kinase [Aliiglaciecola sp. CAU 1673]